MGLRLQKETSRHTRQRDEHKKLSSSELEQREIYFKIIESPEHPRGKRGKFYEVRERKEPETPTVAEPQKETSYAFSVPKTLEICPYIRNITQAGEETYNGTCALTKLPCLEHHAYPLGKDPNCQPYNTVWHPKTSGQAEAIRNASTKDLVAFMDRSEIVRLLKG